MFKRLVSACVIGALAIVGTTACANPLESLFEKVVEDQFGGDFDLDNGGFTIGGEDGSFQVGNATVPADFPSEIALPSTKLMAVFSAAGGWSLTYEKIDEATLNQLLARWMGAGFTEAQLPGIGEEGASGGMQNARWTLMYISAGDSFTLVVAPLGS